jgi:hypothetical protein
MYNERVVCGYREVHVGADVREVNLRRIFSIRYIRPLVRENSETK